MSATRRAADAAQQLRAVGAFDGPAGLSAAEILERVGLEEPDVTNASDPHIPPSVSAAPWPDLGMSTEQEIRARAALAAATALGPAIAVAAAQPFSVDDFGRARDALVDLTEVFAALIRDGSRPEPSR